MASIFGIFDIGKLALFAHQQALSTAAHNIANVSTEGYSRQDAVFETTRPEDSLPGQIGTGVRIAEVRRVVDYFIQGQLRAGESDLGQLQSEQEVLALVEAIFNDVQGAGLNEMLGNFFAALHDLSNDPQGLPERTALLEQARILAQQFGLMDSRLQQLRTDLDGEIRQTLSTVNAIAAEIASLNTQISQVEAGAQNANDLRDERERLLRDLSARIDIHTFEDARGQVTVMVAGGRPLVEASNSFSLQALSSGDNAGFANIAVSLNSSGTETFDISARVSSGTLKGLLDLRDTLLPSYIKQMDQLAAGIVNEFNQQHLAGYGLDGTTGNNFFSPLSPTAAARAANTGTGVVSVSVATASSLTLDDYELSFSGGNYTLRNLDTGTSTTGAYSDPTVVTFEGLQVNISGAPASGDIFSVSAHQGAAGSLSLSLTDLNKIAAASTAAGVPGDNANAIFLAQLRDRTLTPLDSGTFSDFYGTLVGTIGTRSQSAQRSLAAQEIIQKQLGQMREGTSGVSLDEEMADLLRFQRGYEASARLIRIADEMLETLIGLVR